MEISLADTIHLGCDYLIESAEYAEIYTSTSVMFVRPPSAAITYLGLFGDNETANQRIVANNVPADAGSAAIVGPAANTRALVENIGFYIMIKSSPLSRLYTFSSTLTKIFMRYFRFGIDSEYAV